MGIQPGRAPQPADNSGQVTDEKGKPKETFANPEGTPTHLAKNIEQVGLKESDVTHMQDEDVLNKRIAAEQAGAAGVNEDTEGDVYSSHPIANFSIGRFHFNKSTLTIKSAEDKAEFEALLKQMPAPNRILIKKIDTKLAGEIAAAHTESRATKQFDSGVGRQAMEAMRMREPAMGFHELGGRDENMPASPVAKVEGEGESDGKAPEVDAAGQVKEPDTRAENEAEKPTA